MTFCPGRHCCMKATTCTISMIQSPVSAATEHTSAVSLFIEQEKHLITALTWTQSTLHGCKWLEGMFIRLCVFKEDTKCTCWYLLIPADTRRTAFLNDTSVASGRRACHFMNSVWQRTYFSDVWLRSYDYSSVLCVLYTVDKLQDFLLYLSIFSPSWHAKSHTGSSQVNSACMCDISKW